MPTSGTSLRRKGRRGDGVGSPDPGAPMGERSEANVRRRDVEARLIGMPTGPGPDWWAPCWERGARGDLPADVLFDVLTGYRTGVRVLHRVGVAGTTATIDHVLIGSGGVVVAGTEACDGKVRTDGVHLRVRGRDRSEVVDVALWRAEAIRSTLEQRGLRDLPVHGVVHWEQVQSLGNRPHCLRGVPLLSAGATLGLAATGDALSPLTVERVTKSLSKAALH